MKTTPRWFQGYTLGNLLSAQFCEAATGARPGIEQEIADGEFGALRGWLGENIYRHGRKFTTEELVLRATGQPVSSAAYVGYLRRKYGELCPL